MSGLLSLIQARVSTPKLGLPGPSRDQMEAAIVCARRAPDHGRLRPWRFFVLEGDDRSALGQIFVDAALQKDAATPASQLERLRSMPLRAPVVVVAAAAGVSHPKVPVWEQWVAVGASVQNMQLALTEMGFGCIWRTGDNATDPHVLARFGLADTDRIIGFLYVGTAEDTPKMVPDEEPGRVVWGIPDSV